MSQTTIVFPEGASSSPGFNRFDSLPTVATLKKRYLHGVDFKANDGTELTSKAFQFYISEAISWLEHELETTIVPTQYTETHDYRAEEYEAWSFIQLRRKPIISVDEVQFRLQKDSAFTSIPDDWIRLESHVGQIQIAPTSGGLSSINFSQSAFLPRLMMITPDWPSFFRIVYTAGFERDKIPAIISHVIGMKAAIQALNIAGELILGAGIASQSLSIDGLSQSIGSTASASYSGYGARIELYENDIKTAMQTLRRYYGKTFKSVIV